MLRLIKLALLTVLITLLGVQSFAQTSQLFVTDSRVGILRFDGNTGNFLNQFVKPGIGGMSDPIGITVDQTVTSMLLVPAVTPSCALTG